MACKPRQIIGNIFNIARDYNRYCGRVIGNLGSLIPVIGWILDLVKQDSTFTCISDRNVWGYIGDPSAGNQPLSISVPKEVPMIIGGRVVNDSWGVIGDSFPEAQILQPQLDLRTFLTTDDNGGVGGEKLAEVDARLAAYIGSAGYVVTCIMASINDIQAAASDISATMMATTAGMADTCVAEPTLPMLTTVPPFKNAASYTADKMTWADNYDALIIAYAADNDYPLLDLRNILSDDGETLKAAYDSGDGLHPNTAGYQAIGDAMADLNLDDRKMHTTEIDGTTLSPFISKSTLSGMVRVFKAFQNHEVGTPYAIYKQIKILTTAGNYVYMTSSGGTSDATAPVVTDADIGSTVTDNDITWTVNGYATIEGWTGEPSGQNRCVESRDFDNTWTTIGTVTTAQDQIGIDRVAGKAWTLNDTDAGSKSRKRYTITALATGLTNPDSIYIKKVGSASSFPGVGVAFSGGTGHFKNIVFNHITGVATVSNGTTTLDVRVTRHGEFWKIDLIPVDDTADNTIFILDVFPALSVNGTTESAAATGSAIFDWVDIRINQPTIDSHILTEGGITTREAAITSDSTVGVVSSTNTSIDMVVTLNGGGQTAVIWGSYEDAGNYTQIVINPTEVIFRKRVGAADTDLPFTFTHGVKPFRVLAIQDETGMSLQIALVGAAEPTAQANANTTGLQLAATFEQLSDGNGANGASGACNSCLVNNDNLTW